MVDVMDNQFIFISLLLFIHIASAATNNLLSDDSAVDMTHPVDNGLTLQWPSSEKFTFKIVHRGMSNDDGTGFYYETNEFSQNEHSGTHTDAPAHFARGKWRTGQIPFERLAGPAVVIDIAERAERDPDTRLDVADIEKWERDNGRIPDGAIVVMNSGRGKLYSDRKRYFGYPEGLDPEPKDTKNLHFPGFHPEAAAWLVNNRDIIGVGVDTPSVDYGQSKDFEAHQILGQANVWNLENLANVDRLPAKGYTLYNMVYKLRQGSGGPSRVFAVKSMMTSSSSRSFSNVAIVAVLAVTSIAKLLSCQSL